jgi:hypothetical protein
MGDGKGSNILGFLDVTSHQLPGGVSWFCGAVSLAVPNETGKAITYWLSW